MKALILALTGGVVLSLVADVLLPDGEMRKYAKFAIGIVLSIIIATPIINLISSMKNGEFTFEKFKVSETVVEKLEGEKVDLYEKAIEYALKEANIEGEATVYIEGEKVVEVVARVGKKADIEIARTLIQNAFNLKKESVKVYG